jgi:hypothetical protein
MLNTMHSGACEFLGRTPIMQGAYNAIKALLSHIGFAALVAVGTPSDMRPMATQ